MDQYLFCSVHPERLNNKNKKKEEKKKTYKKLDPDLNPHNKILSSDLNPNKEGFEFEDFTLFYVLVLVIFQSAPT